jgi:uncharacterized NAD(P)/FAD-binding protein YdhS
MSQTNITIIGGGACGISAFIELFLRLRISNLHKNIAITIIEENEEVGKGLAFGTKQPGHILNTQADLMGIHHTEPDHFSEWLKDHSSRISDEVVDNEGKDEAFTTRRLYGDYLKEQFEYYFDLAKSEGLQANVIHARATSVTRSGNGYIVNMTDRKKQKCHYLILAPGTPVANNFPELDNAPNYFGAPWPSAPILENIPKTADVGIIGSSLSAIDALMTLTDNKHQGKITCYSLDGLMPRVQAENQEPYECKFLTISSLHKIQRKELRNPTIKEIFRLFMEEAAHHEGKEIDWKKTSREGIPAQKLLKQDIQIAKKGGDALMNIPYALRHQSSAMWKMLDESEKLKFKSWLGGYWAIHRHGMPLINAQRLDKLFDKKQLNVVAGMKEVTYNEKEERFILVSKEQTNKEQYLINATGPAAALKSMKSELMQNLASSGLIEANKTGGINIDTETMQIITDGDTCQNFYALGHITNGLLLDVNAVWFNVKTIGNLCHHVVNHIKSESTI